MTNVTHKFFSMYLFLFITLYMFRAHRAHQQERQIVSIQPLVTVILCWWPRCVDTKPKHQTPQAATICTILLELLMMGIMVPETCWASNKICNKYHLLHLVGILFPHINDDGRSESLQIYKEQVSSRSSLARSIMNFYCVFLPCFHHYWFRVCIQIKVRPTRCNN